MTISHRGKSTVTSAGECTASFPELLLMYDCCTQPFAARSGDWQIISSSHGDMVMQAVWGLGAYILSNISNVSNATVAARSKIGCLLLLKSIRGM